MRVPRPLSAAQVAALRSVLEHGDIEHHMKGAGRAAMGGFGRVVLSLRRRGLIDWRNELTPAGREALKGGGT